MIKNPILTGFSPDPSIIRAGDDYYIATSTFEWWPGVRMFHSKDLVIYEEIQSPLRRLSQLDMTGDPPSGGIWAPCLSYDGNRFFLLYTDVKTKKGRFYNTHNYMVYTDDIYGEWSEPKYLNSIGFDPSLFHDIDGRKYLINMVNGFKGILVQEMDSETYELIGPREKIYDGSGIGYTEGPHMYHIGEYYYLIVAEGGTGYDHCVTMARSKSVWGPFETMPDNPVLTSDKDNPSSLQKCGHADIVEGKDGKWYMVHLCSRPLNGTKWCTLGRETAIQRIELQDDLWFRLANKTKYPDTFVNLENSGDYKENYSFSDDFDGEHMNVSLSSPRLPYENFADLDVRPGYIRIRGQESLNSLHHVSMLATRQRDFNVEAVTKMDFKPEISEQAAGLVYFYDAYNYYALLKTLSEKGTSGLMLIKSDAGVVTDEVPFVELDSDSELELRVEVTDDGNYAEFSYKYVDGEYRYIGDKLPTNILSDEYCRGFTGAHFGIYAHDMAGLGSYADFDYLYVR